AWTNGWAVCSRVHDRLGKMLKPHYCVYLVGLKVAAMSDSNCLEARRDGSPVIGEMIEQRIARKDDA
ncbi:MAG: hypothetical protein ABIS07_13395, partial [Dokdonella sp.]